MEEKTTGVKKKSWAVLIIILTVSVLCIAAYLLFFQEDEVNIPSVSGQQVMMSTSVIQKAYDPDEAKMEEMIGGAFDLLQGFEQDVSLYMARSEIRRINEMAGIEYVQVSRRTYDLLKLAVEYGELSGGAFDVTIAPVTLLWDIVYGQANIPSDESIEEALALVNYREILFREEDCSVMLARSGMMIDLGAIAKGYASDLVEEYYGNYDPQGVILSMGGSNVLVSGYAREKQPYFSVGIRNPRGGQNDLLGILRTTDAVVCTSGDYERYFIKDGVRYHHIFDTETGRPAETDLISVTVVTDNGVYAEYLSTTLFLGGKENLLMTIEAGENVDYEIIAVDSELNVYVTQNLIGIFEPNEELDEFSFLGY